MSWEANKDHIVAKVSEGTATDAQKAWYDKWVASGSPATKEGMIDWSTYNSGGEAYNTTKYQSPSDAGYQSYENSQEVVEYWDPVKNEVVKLDVSNWDADAKKALHDGLGWYENKQGAYVYGQMPSETWTTPDGVVTEGPNPNPGDPNKQYIMGMGEDGGQAYVNTATGETNLSPNSGGTGNQGSGANMQAIIAAIQGMMPSANPDEQQSYTGNAMAQNTATNYTKPSYQSQQGQDYGEVEQKSALQPVSAPAYQPQPVGQPTVLQPQEQMQGLLSNLFNQARKK